MKQHYAKLSSYIAALKDASSTSDVKLVTYSKQGHRQPVFQRLYMCFEAVKKGWVEGCRRIICVDACFLKTFLGGQLMVAIGRDGNEQMFPIAWAAVEGENTLHGNDEHQAILSGIASVFPSAKHRHCARHIFANWNKHHKGDEIKLAFWKIAQSYNLADMNDAYDELKKADKAAALSFKRYNPKCFCRAYMSTSCKADVITSNLAETFNGYIIHARNKHLVDMMEDIRAQ
ncbi:NADPH-dependent D-xylose reductase [Bienertia sinuspersici]